MKESKKLCRFLSIFLVIVMLFGMLVSCAKDPDEDDSESEDANGENVVSTEGANDEPYPYTPYKEDFGGYEFRVLTRGGTSGWVNNDITADYMGDSLSMAIAKRNATVCKKYNFTIKETKDEDFNETALTLAAAGVDQYDMWSFMMRNMVMHGLNGYVWDLRKLKNMHLEADYYDQGVIDTSTYADYLFFVTGDMLYIDEQSTAALVFRYDEFYTGKYDQIYGKDLYALVESGEWTFEKLKMFAEKGTYDKNGNGTIELGDSLGFAYENNTMLALNVGMGNLIMSKDINDTLVVNTNQKQINTFKDIIDFITGSYSFNSDGATSKDRAFIQYVWLNMLREGTIYGQGVDFGIIPYPKATVAQEKYYSLVTTYGASGMAVPTAVADPERAASIIDLLSFESKKVVTPVYETWLLEGKVSQRVEDIKMLQYIFDGQTIEPAHLFIDTGLYDALKPLVKGEGGSVSGIIESSVDMVAAKNKEYLDMIKKLY